MCWYRLQSAMVGLSCKKQTHVVAKKYTGLLRLYEIILCCPLLIEYVIFHNPSVLFARIEVSLPFTALDYVNFLKHCEFKESEALQGVANEASIRRVLRGFQPCKYSCRQAAFTQEEPSEKKKSIGTVILRATAAHFLTFSSAVKQAAASVSAGE